MKFSEQYEPIRAEPFDFTIASQNAQKTKVVKWKSTQVIGYQQSKTPQANLTHSNLAQSLISLQEVHHTFIVNKAKASNPLPPLSSSPTSVTTVWSIVLTKAPKVPPAGLWPPRLQALPTAFGSPVSRSVHRARSQKDSPRRSERVGVRAEWEDEIKGAAGEQLWTRMSEMR